MPTVVPLKLALRATSLAVALLSGHVSFAQPAPEALSGQVPKAAEAQSALDAPLFYQLLIGELGLSLGDPATAYEFVLDAAKRTKEESLFRRAADIAAQAQAGEQALAAVRAWRLAVPTSLDAARYQLQIVIALQRPKEAIDAARILVGLTPAAERSTLIQGLPSLFARLGEAKQAAAWLGQAIAPLAAAPELRATVLLAQGRAWALAGDKLRALDFAQQAQQADPLAPGPALLAAALIPQSGAESLVLAHLNASPNSHVVRLALARTLTSAQRYGEALPLYEQLTVDVPQWAASWLMLGALRLELRQPAQATDALKRFVQLVDSGQANAIGLDEEPSEGAASAIPQALTQAWLLLAQAAEQQGDYAAAEIWLARIDSPQRALDVQVRRASALARQGRIAQARQAIQQAPAQTDADRRARLMAEAQMLREAKQWADALAVLDAANRQFTDDADLLYEQSMVAEKLDRLDEMEQLLRRVIALKPEYAQAYNALGYSLVDRNLRLPEARELIVKALELSPGDPFITDSLGWAEYRLGRREEALRLLRQAYQARPDVEIAAHLGELLWVMDQRDAARQVLREGRGREANNEALQDTLTRLRIDL